MADDIPTPTEAEEWGVTELASLEDHARRHDHKGYSEEMCIRCGWVMGHRPLNCQNDDTPHMFPSQQAEIERLRDIIKQAAELLNAFGDGSVIMDYEQVVIDLVQEEARRG